MAVSGDYSKLRSLPAPDAPQGLSLVNNWTIGAGTIGVTGMRDETPSENCILGLQVTTEFCFGSVWTRSCCLWFMHKRKIIIDDNECLDIFLCVSNQPCLMRVFY